MRTLDVTQAEAQVLLDAVVDRQVRQRKHVQAQEEPSDRAYEILDMLQDLRGRIETVVWWWDC